MEANKKWKREDISTTTVISACILAHSSIDKGASWQIIMEQTGAPEKVVYSAMERDCLKGYIDYGVSLRTSWATEKGKQLLKEYII